MAVKIRLKRMGKIRQPFYRVVVVDSRKKRDGRVIEEIGKYHPKSEPSLIDVASERAQYWLGVGAQPTEAVEAILKVTGDWQKFKGLPGSEGTLRVAEPKRDKSELFNEALKEAAKEPKGEAVTRKAGKKTLDAPTDDAEKAEKPKAEEPKAEEPKAEEPKTEEPRAEEPAEAAAEEPKAEETPAEESPATIEGSAEATGSTETSDESTS